MDELNALILKSASQIVIESISIRAGNPLGNIIRVEFGLPQDLAILNEVPWSRLTQWMIQKDFYGNNQELSIRLIPKTMCADEIADWLAKELKAQGKVVQLKRWIASNTFVDCQI